jgi:hypothetical protein
VAVYLDNDKHEMAGPKMPWEAETSWSRQLLSQWSSATSDVTSV